MRRRFVIEIEDGDDGPDASYKFALQVMALLDTAGYLPDECFREEPACRCCHSTEVAS